MEVVYQDLALAPHLNPSRTCSGPGDPSKGHSRPVGFMDEKPCGKAKAGFGNSEVRSVIHRSGSAMSGGQRQQIAIVRAISAGLTDS